MDDEQKFRHLIAKAKELIHSDSRPNELRKGIAYYKKAYEIHESDKLKKRIKKLEAYLEQIEDTDNDDGDDGETEDGEQMAHVGEGFYVYKELYDKLYAHQREGVLFFWKLWRMKKGGILGDDMGLGKTIQVCAFLAGMFDAERIKSVLIVVPVAVLINWMNEFQKWAPGIDVYDFHDQSKRERERILQRVQHKGGVCLTSYGIVVNNADILSAYNGREFVWDYVILDEGHKIKNPTTKSAKGVHMIPAKNRIVLSGTPLMNNLKELWALFDWTNAGQLLGNAKTFSMEFEGPITRAREKDATAGEQRLGVEMSKSLRDIIAPYFLRRSKMDVNKRETNGEGSAPHMPTMTRKNDLICWVYLCERQQKIYTDFIQTDDVRELLSSTRSPLTALTALKKICDHPRVMTNRQCEQLGLTIGDGIDLDRLDAMVAEDTAHFSVDHIPDECLIAESGKMVFLVELLDNLKAEGHRCLIFSQSRKVLNIIQKVVQNRGHRICRLDGTIRQLEERQRIIERFMKDHSFSIFLLTTQVGGVGLTLTAADRVVIFDPSWNPATDSQAVDRAFRIGQVKDVVVYRLITCGSIEEKIYRRQIFKESINRMTTGDTKNPFRYFTRQDLKELFELSDTRVSVTQQQLEKLQLGMRKTDTLLDAHIAFLYSLEIFGISDHDLMFEIRAQKEIEGEADVDDLHGELYVQGRALKACQTISAESEANMELVKKFGKYPGPQNEDVAKLFKSISSINKQTEGSSQHMKRNFPRPTPQFTLTDAFDPVMSSTLSEHYVEEKLEELALGDAELVEPRSPTPPGTPRSASSADHADELRCTMERRADCLIASANASSSSDVASVEVCRRSVETQRHAMFDDMPRSPYAVVKESMVFSPLLSKPLVSMEVADDGHDELFLANKLMLAETSPRKPFSFSASRKRRSSLFRPFGNSAEGKRMLSSEFSQTAESPVDSPIGRARKIQRLIISSDEEEKEEEEEKDSTQTDSCQANLTLRKNSICSDSKLNSSKNCEDGNSSAGSEEKEEVRDTLDVCDDLTEEEPHSEDVEEEDRSLGEAGVKADEKYNSQTDTPSKTEKFIQQQDSCNIYDECTKAPEISPLHQEVEELPSQPLDLITNRTEDVVELSGDDDDDGDDDGKVEERLNKESDEVLQTETAENDNKETDEKHEDDGEEEEEEEEERNEATSEIVNGVDEEETESEDSDSDEKFESLIAKGRMAYKSQNFEDALVCFTEADEICGGNDALKKHIERIRSLLKTNNDADIIN